MKKSITALVALGLVATFSVANAESHSGYTARSELMKSNGAQAKILFDMASGKTDFDLAAAQAAAQALHDNAEQIPVVFEKNEIPEKSKALPKIWEDFEGFTAEAEGLQMASMKALEATDVESLGVALKDVGASCTSCHTAYRTR